MSTNAPVHPASGNQQGHPTVGNPALARRRMLGLENEFVVGNPTPDSYKIMWGGETLLIPPRHQTVLPHPKFSDVKHSYQLEDGTYLPGTLVIHDIKTQGSLGEDIKRWDSAACMRAKIGIDYEGEYGRRGLFWLPSGFSREEYEIEAQAGLGRWQESKLEDARRIVHEVETQAAVHRERGLVPPVPPPAYEEAKAMLVAAAEKMQVAFAEIMQTRGSATLVAGAEEAASFRVAAEAMGLSRTNTPTPVAVPAFSPHPSFRDLLSDPEFRAEMRAEMLQAMRDGALTPETAVESPEPLVPPTPAGTLPPPSPRKQKK